MATYDPQIQRRRSIRLKGYDYSQPGAYFLTLVTYQRAELFGTIMDCVMKLSALGQIAKDELFRSVAIRPECRLYEDEFIIMPNHIHGIFRIVGADGVRPGAGLRPNDNVLQNNETGAYHAPLQRKPRSLSSFVAGLKSIVASRANHELNMTGIWQRNYYDHIIRNDQDFMNIWAYMDANLQKWQDDQLHPSKLQYPINQE
jgi:REP element-mobilizing transposase RayT